MTDKNNIDINKITQDVGDILATDKSGHGMEHVDRVLVMAMDFAQKEGADSTIVQLAALLHDIDDYKLFGQKHADELINANKILDEYTIDERKRADVFLQSINVENSALSYSSNSTMYTFHCTDSVDVEKLRTTIKGEKVYEHYS